MDNDKDKVKEINSRIEPDNTPKPDMSEAEITPPAVPKKNIELVGILKILGILLLLLILGVGAAIYGFQEENRFVKAVANIVPYPLAMVDYQPLLLSDYWRELDVVLNACEQIGTDCQISATDREQVTNGLVREKVVERVANREGVSVTSEDVDNEFDRIVEENGGEEVFLNLLEEQFNWTVDELKERIYYDLLMRKLQEDKIEQVQAAHILILSDESMSEEDQTKAMETAQGILDRINNGEDFATVAQETSEDPGSDEKGGDLGYFTRGVMVPEFEQAAFSLSAGGVSDLIKTQYGWHIIKVTDKKNEIQSTLEEWLQSEQDNMNVWIWYNKQ